MIEFEILVRGVYRPAQLLLTYDSSLRLEVSATTRQWMDAFWKQAQAQNSRLFDAPLYRYIAAHAQPDGPLSLTLGDTSYKEYVVTRNEAYAQGKERAQFGNPLAVCSVVETADGFLLLDKREGVDVYVGRYHVIGGFFERDLDGGAKPDPFAAMRREIREETGITVDDISEQLCLGLVYDLRVPHAELCFLTRLHISLAEVCQRKPEDNEIQQLRTLQVDSEALRTFIIRNHGNISATGEPNLLFYGAWKFGDAWFDEVYRRIKEGAA
ncbi:hypothetical protein EI42_06085 [Thermosporothrix hazakensis]|jgi:8-oxo-dGTP pyrophosphatase MutT (NUDIX family)|uniref:Nudix hydrolase domain-containing protein n=1 Tax=Thermosporothrix hazakensis TaxID=644383 RepID=A0A326TTW4_THEHA|nr:NUDIX domain-containing protein [Thermosporothrix hazakensis]PZW19389.1 hypothetical protein EI42_06085 [Thermosporothrix hazakensis]GCE48055.1 hypothetical protein KTH_29240 [Thermosporothrix hazakensis]